MSVVVRMEMPSSCERCPLCGTASGGNGVYKLRCMCGDIPASSLRRPKDCPILCQLPEGHGDLVEAKEITVNVKIKGKKCSADVYATTIVPAERREA